MVFFNHMVPNAEAQEVHGPLRVLNYLRPALLFVLPMVVFLAGISFAVGEWTRRPVLVFLLPVVVFLGDAFFLWDWSPSWLDPRMNNVLMWLDPSGFRWLNETWIKVDRGVNFYNQAAIPPDRGFLISRMIFMVMGLGAVALSVRNLAVTVRGSASKRVVDQTFRSAPLADAISAISARPASIASLAMTSARPGLFAGARQVATVELAELASSPGLYLFIPLILLQTILNSILEVGFLDTPLLITSGTFVVRGMGALTTCVCLLLLFYAVESLERERSTRLAAIAFATPIRTGSLLLGKGIALLAVALAIAAATALGGIIALLIQAQGWPRT